jgi:hypothetical protein
LKKYKNNVRIDVEVVYEKKDGIRRKYGRME